MGRFARLLKAAVVVPVPDGRAAPVLLPSNRGRPAVLGPPFHGRIELPGVTVDVENAKGSYREGTGPDGKPWRTYMRAHYGEIRGSEGRDGDAVDAYVGPDAHSPLAVVVHQVDPDTGDGDEDKVMLGWRSEGDAVAAYKRQYDRPGFYGGHTAMGLPKLVALVTDPDRRGKMLGGAPAESRRLGREEWAWHAAADAFERDGHDLGRLTLVELPEDRGAALWGPDGVAKAATGTPRPGAKYVKRVPTGNQKRPWRYFYAVHHGGGIGHHEHMVTGARFRDRDGGHYEVTAHGEHGVTVRHSETGHEEHLTREALTARLHEHHAAAIREHEARRAMSPAVRRQLTPEARAERAKEEAIARLKPEIAAGQEHAEWVKSVYHAAVKRLTEGGRVHIRTMTRITPLDKRHKDYLSLTDGRLFLQNGNSKTEVSFMPLDLLAHELGLPPSPAHRKTQQASAGVGDDEPIDVQVSRAISAHGKDIKSIGPSDLVPILAASPSEDHNDVRHFVYRYIQEERPDLAQDVDRAMGLVSGDDAVASRKAKAEPPSSPARKESGPADAGLHKDKVAKGPDVEALLSAIMHRGGHDKATAIRIAKARGLIHQAGEHLAMGAP